MSKGRHQKPGEWIENDLLHDQMMHPSVDVSKIDSPKKEVVQTCLGRCCYYPPRHRRGA